PPGQGAGVFNNYIAWASLGRAPDAGVPARNTYDIYFANSTTMAGSVGNPVIRLFSPDSTPAGGPLHQTDERYPTWSSALPPQNPIDRIACSSNRQNNINNLAQPGISATDTDIWASEVTDLTPPSLFGAEEVGRILTDTTGPFPGRDFSFLQGNIVHITNARLPNRGSRSGAPGETFFFYAAVKDLQYGVNSVWAQIKDPDGPTTDAQNVNHKLYGRDAANTFVMRRQGDGQMGATHFITVPYEMDCQGVNVFDFTSYNGPLRNDVASPVSTQLASRNPGVDDSVAWSGNQIGSFSGVSNAPLADRWLPMRDDGVAPDDRAGDGVYSAQWTTPTVGSDYYVDLIAYDNAFNPRDPTQQQNHILYDNTSGFSTQAFVSRNPVLVVDDHGLGQKWPRGLKGRFRAFPTYRLGTEGEVTSRPMDFWARERFRGAPRDIVDPQGFLSAARVGGGPNVVPGNRVFDFLNGDLSQVAAPGIIGTYDFIGWRGGTLQAYRYDLWRILARGPVPDTVLADYSPVRDEQPADITGANIIRRPVPRRAVFWNAPYMGDIFIGAGSILDQATQRSLTTYRNNAGRLVVAGGDVLWALTVNGTVTQQFAQDVLGADFTGDIDPTNALTYARGGGPIQAAIFDDAASGNFAPIAGTTAAPFFPDEYDLNPIGIASHYPDNTDGGNNGGSGAPNVERSAAPDAVPFQQQDGCNARAGFEQILTSKMVGRNDTAGTQSKTIFCSFSMASFGRRVFSDNDDPTMADPLNLGFLACMNYKSKMAHAMFCWMFSANITGQVRSLSGGVPVVGAFVEMIQGGQVVGTAFTRPDGTYQIRGLPVGGWGVRVSNPGFLAFNKDNSAGAHGLGQASLDVLLTPAAPASLSGRVLDQFDQPVPNTRIKAVLRASPLFTGTTTFVTTTLPDGQYTLTNLPVGTYDVSVGAPFPSGFDNPTPATRQAVLNPAQNTPNIDFRLRGNPGPLTVRVFEQREDGTRGPAVEAAGVSLLDATNTPLTGFVAVTDATGEVIFSDSD
ncbi:MAG: carboxypeptidase regulatory-like domain-containing protein, partial [Armatimonadetes bacterium]|nr:carboxypeptidase regulatory-like domain-containing protein [Armatimonadota bacterium]